MGCAGRREREPGTGVCGGGTGVSGPQLRKRGPTPRLKRREKEGDKVITKG